MITWIFVSQSLVILLSVFGASFLANVAGFGLGTVLVPITLNFFPVMQAMIFVAVIHLFNAIWKTFFWIRFIRWNILLYFGCAALPGALAGAYMLSIFPATASKKIIGVFIICYVVINMVWPYFKVPATRFALMGGGVLTGFSAGFFGIRGAIKSVFLTAYRLPKETYLATMGAIDVVVDITRLSGYIYHQGTSLQQPWWLLLTAIITSFAGAKCGQLFVGRLDATYFRLIVFGLLIIAGLRLILW